MKTHVPVDEPPQLRAQKPFQTKSGFEDARPEAVAQQSLQRMVEDSPRNAQLKSTQAIMMKSMGVQRLQVLQAMANHHVASEYAAESTMQAPVQRLKNSATGVGEPAVAQRHNNAGLPDNLKSGIESLSGMSMDHVKVHYNSAKPAQLLAHAYAQGNDIHLAPGQERHLPHEAWHVVQQAQGRVRPTMQMKRGVPVNDDAKLEREADVMGARAMGAGNNAVQRAALSDSSTSSCVVQRAELAHDKLNVAGERHDISDRRRPQEAAYSLAMTGGGYWREPQFKISDVSNVSADDFELRAKNLIAFAKDAELGNWNNIDSEKFVASLLNGLIKLKDLELPLAFLRPDELEYYKAFIPLEVYREYSDTLLTDGKPFEKTIGLINNAYLEYRSTGDPQWRSQLLDAVMMYQIHFAVLDIQIKNVAAALEIVSSGDLSRQRSVKMHQAANNRAGTMGLWKVGENHAQHMVSMTPKSYKLLTKTEFNAGYKLFMARSVALAKIRGVAFGNWSPYTKWKSTPNGVSAIKAIINAGGASTATVLRSIKARATTDNAKVSEKRHAKTAAFYAALSAMDVNSLDSVVGISALMDGINL